MKTAIIVDSTAYLDDDLRNHPDIYELVLTTTFADGTEFIDSSDTEIQTRFYEKLTGEEQLPKTSQPAPGTYIELIEEIIDKGYDHLLCIHLSQAFSGTYQTAKMLTSEYEDQLKICVMDSKGTSEIVGGMVEQGLEMIEKGLAFEDICEKLHWVAENSTIYFTVADLYNLVKGGRLNMTAARIGNVLKVRPLLYVDADGEVAVLDKIRTDKKVNRILAKIAKEDAKKYPNGIMLRFTHAVDEERLQASIAAVSESVPHLDYKVGTLGPVIGTHTGTGTVGMGTIAIADY